MSQCIARCSGLHLLRVLSTRVQLCHRLGEATWPEFMVGLVSVVDDDDVLVSNLINREKDYSEEASHRAL